MRQESRQDRTVTLPTVHGNCFNGSHYDAGRVEIRLVGGHDTFAAFRNTGQLYLTTSSRRR